VDCDLDEGIAGACSSLGNLFSPVIFSALCEEHVHFSIILFKEIIVFPKHGLSFYLIDFFLIFCFDAFSKVFFFFVRHCS